LASRSLLALALRGEGSPRYLFMGYL
jgi:hypothetical protein